MSREVLIACAVCAWRGDCAKKFRMADAKHCPDFSRDITLPKPAEHLEEQEEQAEEDSPSAEGEKTE